MLNMSKAILSLNSVLSFIGLMDVMLLISSWVLSSKVRSLWDRKYTPWIRVGEETSAIY